jgi:hypothetical protein
MSATDHTAAVQRAAAAAQQAQAALDDARRHGDTDEQLAAREAVISTAHALARLRLGGEAP